MNEQRGIRTIEVRQCPSTGRWRVAPAGREPATDDGRIGSRAVAWVAWIDERDDAVAYARGRLTDSGGGTLKVVVDGQVEQSLEIAAARPDGKRGIRGDAASFPWPPARAAGLAASGT